MRNIEQYKQLHNQEKDYGNSKDFFGGAMLDN